MNSILKIHKQIQKAEKCYNCGNIFRVELVIDSPDYNDFGFRYCPFCGTFYDELEDEEKRKVVSITL